MTITAKRNGYGVSIKLPSNKVQLSTQRALERMLTVDLDDYEMATRGKLSGKPTEFEFTYET